ncbi:MAG: hypothetical protein MHPDNHAH_03327 [Anaerolineales bacterium]|nr:hypothetical protein [Anaerolineales bacterium]
MDRKTIITGVISFLLIGALTFVMYLFAKPNVPLGTTYGEPYPPAMGFTLTRADGSVFNLSDYRGSLVLLFFGYTSCPDVCPTTLAELNLALEGLRPADAAQVTVLFVTVDPARDTPERVQTYVNNFNSDFIGLSGTEEELTPIWNGYGIYRAIPETASSAGYLVDHTARVTLIDRQGNLRVSFPYDAPVADIVHDLKLMLRD